MIDISHPWQHVSGYRLNADGKALRYEHVENDLELYVEAMVEPDCDTLVYRPSVMTESEFVEYPDRFVDKQAALDRLEELADEYE